MVNGLHVEGAANVGVDHGHGLIDASGGAVTDGQSLKLTLDAGHAVV